jgi:hypothetical protein
MAQTLYLHYLQDGTCNLGFAIRKTQYLIPAILLLRVRAQIHIKTSIG